LCATSQIRSIRHDRPLLARLHSTAAARPSTQSRQPARRVRPRSICSMTQNGSGWLPCKKCRTKEKSDGLETARVSSFGCADGTDSPWRRIHQDAEPINVK
jgi:hypothetical protein